MLRLILACSGHMMRGASAILQSHGADVAEVHLLFARGKRPDRKAIRAWTARQHVVSISHDPQTEAVASADASSPGQQEWIELLRDGLTFDLCGLAPGSGAPFPIIEHRFDLSALPQAEAFEALSLRPGPHLSGGRSSLPVIRTLFALACDMIRRFEDLIAVSWSPSRSAIGRQFFESVTSAWLDGGPFPALGLTAFAETPDHALQSIGLAYWTGQELRIEPPLSADRVAATRLAIRLVNHLVLTGGLDNDDRIIAPDGTRLVLRPARSRALISVWRE